MGVSAPRPRRLAAITERAATWAAGRPWALPVLAAALGIAVRVWLAIHTQAMIDGDEAMVGIQAERILHGQFPVYFYGQAYMGVLEAYLIAPLIALLGPTTWALRLVPIALSPLLPYFTYRLARVLLPPGNPATPLLAGLAALVAGVPPLYAAVAEMRAWGGQIEVYIISLAVLLCAAELSDRVRAGAGAWELTRRWAILGVVAGLGLWINPLIVYALVASALWLLAALLERAAPRLAARVGWRGTAERADGQATVAPTQRTGAAPTTVGDRPADDWRRLVLPLLAVLPGAVIGGLPAWLYALRNSGANLLVYVTQPAVSGTVSGAARHGRLFLGAAIAFRYVTCVAPSVLDGRLPTESNLLLPLRLALLVPPLLAIASGLWLVLARRGSGQPLRVGLPLLFAGVVSAIYCAGTAAWPETQTNGCAKDLAGRYGIPLVLAEPLLLLALLALPAAVVALRARVGRRPTASGALNRVSLRAPAQAVPLVVLVLVVAGLLQTATYATASSTQTFQSPYYHRIPATTAQLVAYLRQHDIHAAWCNHWLGNIVTFETDGATTCADYYDQVYHGGLQRPPGTLAVVAAAERPSFILILTDPHPCLARQLDARGIGYTLAVLTGDGVTVITPDRTVDPATVLAGLGQDYLDPSVAPELACPV